MLDILSVKGALEINNCGTKYFNQLTDYQNKYTTTEYVLLNLLIINSNKSWLSGMIQFYGSFFLLFISDQLG